MSAFLEKLSSLLLEYEAEISVDVNPRDGSTDIEINSNEGHWYLKNISWIDYEDIKDLLDDE